MLQNLTAKLRKVLIAQKKILSKEICFEWLIVKCYSLIWFIIHTCWVWSIKFYWNLIFRQNTLLNYLFQVAWSYSFKFWNEYIGTNLTIFCVSVIFLSVHLSVYPSACLYVFPNTGTLLTKPLQTWQWILIKPYMLCRCQCSRFFLKVLLSMNH